MHDIIVGAPGSAKLLLKTKIGLECTQLYVLRWVSVLRVVNKETYAVLNSKFDMHVVCIGES